MFSKTFLCLLFVLVAHEAAADRKKCEKKFNVEKSDWEEFKKNSTEPTEKMLCFAKCEYEDSGVLNADKTVNSDKLIEQIGKWTSVQETAKAEIKECVDKLTVPVNSCADVKPYHLCVLRALEKQAAGKGKCAKELNLEQPDWDAFKKNPSEPAEKMLCFFKCEYESSGVFNADKTVNADKLIEHIEKWKVLQESTKTEIKECVQKLTVPVNSCPDVKPYHICVHTAVQKELKSTA